MSERPPVDVVVPFAGTADELRALIGRLGAVATRPGDTVVVADNRGVGVVGSDRVRVVDAHGRRGSYHARNVGARTGAAPWLLFVDADVEPARDLLDRLFEPSPGERTAVLAGAVVDEPPPAGGNAPAALRYAWLKSSMSQENTLGRDSWAFAQTANCAVRRGAFAEVGGFCDEAVSGGDADLCFRLEAAGWRLESRPGATVLHRNRTTISRMLAQRARHGAGAAWLARRHPGALPPRRPAGLAWWSMRRAAGGLGALLHGDRDAALVGLLDGPAVWAFELGRRLPARLLGQPRR